ncbi:TPA: DnaD domain protein [Streptococcus equi subsp. zooepidemicus]|uniref:DnaD domain protein n=1 Tax=Streptococcus equi TaxID=1336 RepID=UPI0010C2D811|nr:DnaD domain protein [Streptococcus equi]MCD3394731.1 DnaD domain protein [Streptococcus equi subsp. zooepidemicus]MCD3450281.1 DnaD domain protein [Streptococcus equi subsp. zooepidemicus]VTP88255.1 Phage replication protein [Streptococcus equi subsp. zooepidemicus]HEK9995234.1 DnaD domain protein [Streptococcus equi subsp. zooepidemicus]HEK9998013.1 DnaD domain protein [Streptococcus equi subsp. zooepidemicus]
MAEEKRYWWLKMEHDFFEQKEMKALKRMAAGYVYTTIYLKLLLKSLKNNGSLYFESIEDDFVSELAFDIDETVEDVGAVFDFLKRKGLLVEISEDEVSLPGAVQRIGSKTQSAVRMERMREKKKRESGVTTLHQTVTLSQDSYVEKSREEKIRDRERVEVDKERSPTPPTLNQDFVNLYKSFEAESGKPLSPIQQQELQYMLEDFSADVIHEALREAVGQGKANFAYIQAILKRWKQDNLLTVELIRNNKAAREAKKQQNNSKPEPQTREEWLANWSEENPF